MRSQQRFLSLRHRQITWAYYEPVGILISRTGRLWKTMISNTLEKSLKNRFSTESIISSGNVIAWYVDLDDKIKKFRYGHFKCQKNWRMRYPIVVDQVAYQISKYGKSLTMFVENVQQQDRSEDCGPFAIAYAVILSLNQDPVPAVTTE